MLPSIQSRLLIGELKLNNNNKLSDGSLLCPGKYTSEEMKTAKNSCRLNFRKFYKDYILKAKDSTKLCGNAAETELSNSESSSFYSEDYIHKY